MSQNARRLLLLCPAIVAVAAMALNVRDGTESATPAELPQPVEWSQPVDGGNAAIADPMLTSVLDGDDSRQRAQMEAALAEEDERLRLEAEEIARAKAELAQLETERARLEQQLLGGDPTALPALQSSSDAGRGISNIDFCNNSSTEVRVAMVRSNGTFAALTGDSWIADGFYSLAPSECIHRRFGWGQSLASGYVSIFRKEENHWVALTTEDDGDDDDDGAATFSSHERSICWPESATAVDLNRSCPDSQNNIQFTHWFSTSGNVYEFRITVTDSGVQKYSRYRS